MLVHMHTRACGFSYSVRVVAVLHGIVYHAPVGAARRDMAYHVHVVAVFHDMPYLVLVVDVLRDMTYHEHGVAVHREVSS